MSGVKDGSFRNDNFEWAATDRGVCAPFSSLPVIPLLFIITIVSDALSKSYCTGTVATEALQFCDMDIKSQCWLGFCANNVDDR